MSKLSMIKRTPTTRDTSRPISSHKTSYLLYGLLCIGLLSGCLKYDQLYSPADGKIFMPQASNDRGTLTLYKIDSVQTVYFGATMGGFSSNKEAIQVSFAVDTSLVAAYNEEYGYLGTNFVVLPDKAYTLEGLTTTIAVGSSSANALPLHINTAKLNSALNYMLPIKIAAVSKGQVDSALAVTYFKIDSLQVRSRDITRRGQLSVSNDNTNGPTGKQGSSFVVDGDPATKFFCPDYNSDFWIAFAFDQPEQIDAYTLSAANDRPDRDPRSWQFQGSDDGQNWVTLDSKENYTFTGRFQEGYFEINHADLQTAFKHYRIQISENNGAGKQFQLAELRLLQYY